MSVAACGNQTEETAAETAVETSAEETVEETEETVAVESEAVETEAAVEIEYSIDEAILGTWNLEDNGIVTVYTFSADGQTLALYVDGIESDRAVYVIDGDTLTISEDKEAIILAR